MTSTKLAITTTAIDATNATTGSSKLVAVKRKITLDMLFEALPPYVHTPVPDPDPCLRWMIYLLTSRTTRESYVGLTTRALETRLRAHGYQAKRDRAIREGGLMAALQKAHASGQTLEQAFEIRVVATAKTASEARLLEHRWIALIGCRKPNGLNDLPGGGLGGPGNSVEFEIRLPSGQLLWYGSVHAAISARNYELRRAGKEILQPSTIYARLAAGWPPIEAMDYIPHQDGRSLRPAFKAGGQLCTTLGEVTARTGICADTWRSRLHRRMLSGSTADAMLDMRRPSAEHQPRRSGPLNLRLPGEPLPVTAAVYAERTGMAKSTILHRWHAGARYGLDVVALSPRKLLVWLTTPGERRNIVSLQLPDGRHWTGGERELIRKLFADPAIERARAMHLSSSGVRRRLRTLTGDERAVSARVQWAFGFTPVKER